MQLKEELFSRFIGLYIMKLPIPKDLGEFVRDNKCPSEDKNIQMIVIMIIGATSDSPELRQLVKSLI